MKKILKKVKAPFQKARFHTTFALHQKATKIGWYKKWHDKKYSHHVHRATAILFAGLMTVSAVLNLIPSKEMLLAANGSWSQTTFAGSGDGTYTSTVPYNTNADVGLAESGAVLSNAGGGSWQYKRPITVTNGSGGTLTDHQLQIQPFTDAAFLNNSNQVGSWHMNESSGNPSDSSGNNITSTATGTPTYSAGKFANGINLNGSTQYVDVGTAATTSFIQNTGVFTVETWLKYNNYTVVPQYIMGTSGASAEKGFYFGQAVAGYLRFYMYKGVGGSPIINADTTQAVISDNNWHHVAVTGDGTNITFYVDGIKYAGTGTMGTKSSGDSTRSLNLGRINALGSGYFGGQIDELKMYNRAITGPATNCGDSAANEVCQRYGTSGVPKIRGDYQDIRFAKGDGTELPYWKDTDGKFWVKYSGNLAAGDTSIYMYYGNPSGTFSTSAQCLSAPVPGTSGYANCGKNTFSFFDDGENYTSGNALTTGGWVQTDNDGGTGQYSNSIKHNGSISLNINKGGGTYFTAFKNSFTSRSTGVLEFWFYDVTTCNLTYYGNATTTVAGPLFYNESSPTQYLMYTNAYYTTNINRTAGWHLGKAVHKANGAVDFYVDGVLSQNNAGAGFLSSADLVKLGNFQAYGSGNPNTYWDEIRVRNYAATEPTHTAPGTEEAGGGYAASGTFVSVAIPSTVAHQGKVYGWGDFTFTNTLNGQTITYDVLNGATGNTIPGYTGITTSPTSLAGISAYTYPSLKVRANMSGNGSATPLLNDWAVAYTYDVTAPSIPTGLNISNKTNSSITLAWSASTDAESGLSGYQITKAPDVAGVPGTWVSAGGTCAGTINVLNCIDQGLSSNTKYYYRVRAVDNVGNNSLYGGVSNNIVIKPDGAAGFDNQPYSATPTTNFGTNAGMHVGELNNTAGISRTLIKFDLTGNLPASAQISSATLSINADADFSSNSRDFRVYRIKRAWTELGSTWNKYDGVNDWQIAGGFGANDTEQTDIGSRNFTATETLVAYKDFALTTTAVQEMFEGSFTNNGFMIKADTETDDAYRFATSDGVTESMRPKLTLNYETYVSAYTLQNTPVIDSVSTPTNDATPIVTNSGNPNASYENYTANLYDGVDKVGVSKANESGVFSFGNNKTLNSSFEVDTNPADGVGDDWTAYKNVVGTVTRTISNQSMTGNYSQRMQYVGEGGDSGGAAGFYQQPANGSFQENGTAIGSVHIKGITSDGSTAVVNLRAFDSGGTALGWGVSGAATLTSDWVKLTSTYANLPLSTSTVRIYIYVTSITGGDVVDAYIDNVELTNYNQSLSQGSHTLTIKVVNGDNIESEASNSAVVNVDTTAPIALSASSAWTNSGKTSQITDNAWSRNNNGESVYFEWSGAADNPPPDPSAGLKRYWVYFGSDGNAIPRVSGSATADTTASGTFNLTAPTSGNDYYFRVQTEDNAGNISADGSVTTLFTYKFDNTPPTAPTSISVNPVTWATDDPYTFTWTGATDAHSDVYGYEYKRANGTDDWSYTANTNVDVDHYQSGVNYFYVQTKDNAGNTSESYVSWPYLYSGNVAAPQNLQVDLSQSQGQTVNNFKFTWDPPAVGNTVGYYYSVNNAPNPQNSVYTTNDFTDFGPFAVANNQIQTFYVVAKDDFGNIGWTNSVSTNFTVNTVAPGVPQNVTISDSSNRASENWALTISWNPLTGQPAGFDGYEVWRCTANCDNEANFNDKRATVTTNIYSEAGLNNTTDYYYKIKAKDNVSNTSAFSDSVNRIPTGNYVTPPTYTSGPNVNAKALGATLTWTTDRASSSKVYYGADSVSCPGTGFGSDSPVTDHTVDLVGLTPGTTYKYKIQSLDEHRDYSGGDATACSEERTFTTQSAPGISDVTVSEIRLTTAIITWKTTSSATSKILYGTSTAYGSTYTDSSGSQVTTHTVQLTGLSDSTTYNFKIQGTDIDGNVLNSDNYVFTTLTFPRLSNLKVEQVTNSATSTVKVSFSSNVPTTAQVNVSGDGGKSASSYDLKTTHELTVSGLKDNTAYTITVQARDQYGNNANALSEAYKTQFDTRPPEISNITTETDIVGLGLDAKGQVIVSWTTDEPATSQVEYGAGATGSDYSAKTQEDIGLTQNHVVIISDLKTSSPYHFRVVSRDNAKNEALSEDNSVLTDQASESVIDLIIRSLQSTIGWIFNVFNR